MPTGTGEMAEKIVDDIIENLSIQDETKWFWEAVADDRKAEMRDIRMLLARRVIERGR